MNFSDVLTLVQVVVVIGGGFFLFGRLGAQLTALTEAIGELRETLTTHDERIRTLEMKR